jgi:CheY-like chemotaxis protein
MTREPAGARTILLIDDDDTFRKMARVMLETAGYEVEEAANGEVGLRRYRERLIDLVITDILMPETEGFETILELRRFDPHVRILAITAADEMLHGYLRSAEIFGAVQSLRKPFSRSELLAAVGGALGS